MHLLLAFTEARTCSAQRLLGGIPCKGSWGIHLLCGRYMWWLICCQALEVKPSQKAVPAVAVPVAVARKPVAAPVENNIELLRSSIKVREGSREDRARCGS